MQPTITEKAKAGFAILCGALLVAFVYYPTLRGPFLLDDFAWLPMLSVTSSSPFSLSFWNFALIGNFPLGRILPMASFALQSASWPAHPEHFKLVNLLIHLCNYVLLIRLLRDLLVALPEPRPIRKPWLFALIAATLWAVSPSNIGAVAYVIQRMNLMATLFVIVALIAYLFARRALIESRTTAFMIGASGTLISTALALISKENAIAIALIISVMECKLPLPAHREDLRWLQRSVIVVPWAGLLAFLALRFDVFRDAYVIRDFSMAERLMFAPELLFTYAKNVFFPAARDLSLLQDDIVPPASATIPLLLAACWAGVIYAASRTKDYLPRIAGIGVFWFLAAHFLEAGIIPLELYYPHRNYLPSIGIALAATAAIYFGMQAASGRRRLLTAALATPVVAGMLFIAYVEALTWANERTLVTQWHLSHPASDRATLAHAIILTKEGKTDAATQLLLDQQSRRSNDILTVLERAFHDCTSRPDFKETRRDWRSFDAEYPIFTVSLLKDLVELYVSETCRPYSFDRLMALIDVLDGKPGYDHKSLWFAKARLLAAEERFTEAAEYTDKAFRISGRVNYMIDTANLIRLGKGVDAAREYLEQSRPDTTWRPRDLLLNATIDKKLRLLESRNAGN